MFGTRCQTTDGVRRRAAHVAAQRLPINLSLAHDVNRTMRASRGFARIPMMQSADSRQHENGRALAGRLNVSLHRSVFAKRKVRAVVGVVGHVLAQQAEQVVFVEHDHVVESVARNTGDPALDLGILPGRAQRRALLRYPSSGGRAARARRTGYRDHGELQLRQSRSRDQE